MTGSAGKYGNSTLWEISQGVFWFSVIFLLHTLSRTEGEKMQAKHGRAGKHKRYQRAAVLALAMLTACGEEAPQSLGQRAENLMIESFNKAYDTTYQNDADLKNKVGAMLNQIDENGEIDIASLNKSKMYGLPCDVVDNKDGTGTFTVYVIAQGINADKTKYKAIEVTEELLSQANANNVNKISSQKPEAVGAASIVKNGKTYVGVAYRMTVKANFNA